MISTYSELQTSIADWLDREDLTTKIPDFIRLAEANMKRSIFTMGAEIVATTDTIPGLSRLPVPSDYIGIRGIKVEGGSVLKMVSVDKLNASYASDTSGSPIMFSITSDYFLLAPTPDSTYTIELDYYGFTPLSDTDTTNWILTKHPDVYLFGSLLEAKGYIMDIEKMAMWKSRYEDGLNEINERDRAERYGADFRSRPYGMSIV